jgi:hypothetical protein
MKRLLLLLAIVLAALGAIGAAVVRSSDAAAAHKAAARAADEPRVKTIVFRAREPFPPRFLDIAKPAGPSPGDEGIEKEILSRNGKRIGYDLLHFTAVTAPPLDVVAHGVLILRGGQIELQGETTFRHIRVAVIGGTGIYQGASGELTILRTLPGEVDVDRLRLVMPER